MNRLLFDVSDADLAAELIKNCPEAQRLAVERFAPQVRRLLRRSLGQENDVEDLEQEVFLCLFRRIRALKEPGSLRPFIMAIALRSVFHEQRRRRRFAHVTLEPELAQIGPATKRDEAVASYALARLGKLVFGLPKRERSTFLLRFVEGMTVTEIAHALQLSEATTRRSFNRAWLSVSKRAARDLFLSDYFGGTPCSIEVD
ncbi:MAG: sigma-70 family RNA polymerase sigma factor [Myxococcales bacterium]